MILVMLANGDTIDEIVQDYGRDELPPEAVSEAIKLAHRAFVQVTEQMQFELA